MLNATWRLRLIPKSSGAEKASFGIKNCVTTNDGIVCWRRRCGHYPHLPRTPPHDTQKKKICGRKKWKIDMYIITWDLHLVTLSQITYWYSYLLLLKKGLAKYTQPSTYLSASLPPRDRQVDRQGDQNDPGVNASWPRDQSSFDLVGRRALHSRSAQLLQDSTPPPTKANAPRLWQQTRQTRRPPPSQEDFYQLSPPTHP